MGRATAGGVIRDCSSTWVIGFVFSIGCCSVIEAGLWGIVGASSLHGINSSGGLLGKPIDRHRPLFYLVSEGRDEPDLLLHFLFRWAGTFLEIPRMVLFLRIIGVRLHPHFVVL
ncbi:hypothetical protein V2J09_023271 [Rumex salicifolius]